MSRVSSTGKEEMRGCRGAKEMEVHFIIVPWVEVALRRKWPEEMRRQKRHKVCFKDGRKATVADGMR